MSDVEAIHVEWELLDPEGDAETCLPPLHIGLFNPTYSAEMTGAAHIGYDLSSVEAQQPGPAVSAVLRRAEEVVPAKDTSGQTSAATQAASQQREAPVGTRRKWHNRIVEKLKDGSWHVVGHVAGLEDPKVVENLVPTQLSQDELLGLITKVLHHMYETGEHKPQTAEPDAGLAKQPPKGAKKGYAMKAEDAFKAAADALQRASDVLKAAVKNVPEKNSDSEAGEMGEDETKGFPPFGEKEEKACSPKEEMGKGSVPAPVLGQLPLTSAGGSMVPGVDAPKAGEFAVAGYAIAGMGLDPGVDAPLPPEIGLGMDGGAVYIPDGMTW